MTSPDFKKFKNHFESGKSQLIWRWLPGDLETPVSAWLKLCHDQPYSFLLESVEGGATLGRYSAIGLMPDLIWRYPEDKSDHNGLDDLKKHIDASHIDIVDEGMPPMAASGLFGYLGYDMIRLIEDIPQNNPDTLEIPESVLIRPTVMVIFDNVKSRICLCTPVRAHKDNTDESAQDIYAQAQAHLDSIQKTLDTPLSTEHHTYATKLETPLQVDSQLSKEDYQNMVRQAVEYIRAGDIFQVVPSLRFSAPFDLPSIELYRALRQVNPSPFLFLLQFEDLSLVGSSPEILVRVRDQNVTIRPIAGTRPRGKTAAEDRALAQDLLADEKERAEHLMLLDLGRNDVGRVSEIGSVNVTEEFAIENYSHVMHIVSNVEGKLRPDLNPLDALFAGFPAGTVSGAPKIRAMEIIDELEPIARSFYAGCVGYLSGQGDIDTCIALRTALIKDGQVYVQAGAGIVADSDPASEYQECRNKARALIDAAEIAIRRARQRK